MGTRENRHAWRTDLLIGSDDIQNFVPPPYVIILSELSREMSKIDQAALDLPTFVLMIT